MIKAIIFDCFGVLITDALDQILDEYRERDPALVAEVVGVVNAGSKGIISWDVMHEQVAALLDITVDQYHQQIGDGEAKNYELLSYISELKQSHKTGLLSNVGKHGLVNRFTPEELTRHFDAVVISGEIGFAKPEAQAYEITAERLDVRLEECIFVDDREEYCQGARAVGMKAIRYENVQQVKQSIESLTK